MELYLHVDVLWKWLLLLLFEWSVCFEIYYSRNIGIHAWKSFDFISNSGGKSIWIRTQSSVGMNWKYGNVWQVNMAAIYLYIYEIDEYVFQMKGFALNSERAA